MRILLFGKNGQLGRELESILASEGELLALSRDGDEKFCGNLLKPESIRKTILAFKPDVIFNAAAFTHVDLAETETEAAFAVNAKAPAVMAEASKAIEALLVHFSTDYVFDGTSAEPYQEDNTPNPINVYGLSKLEGEKAIRQTNCDHLIIRTGWVYSAHGTNFIKTILRLAQTKETLRVVDDQWGTPTSAAMLARISTKLALSAVYEHTSIKETYHVVPGGITNRFVFAQWIIESAHKMGAKNRLKLEEISPVKSKDYPLAASRPLHAALSNNKLKKILAETEIHHWKVEAEKVMRVLIKKLPNQK